MSIKFECPHCQKMLKAADTLAGKKCRCTECKQPVVVPGTPTAAAAVDGAAPPRPNPPSPPPSRPAPARAPVAAKGGDGAAGAFDKRPAARPQGP